MDQKDIKYYLGIGGIDVFLAKYLFDSGHQVMGYDKKQSIITDKLIASEFQLFLKIISSLFQTIIKKITLKLSIPLQYL